LFLFISVPIITSSQEEIRLIQEAEKYKNLGNGYLNSENQEFVKARINFELAADNYLKAKDYSNAVLFYNSVAYLYNLENDFYNFKKVCTKSYDIAFQHLEESNPWYISSLEQLNTSHFIFSEYNKSLKILHEVFDLRTRHNHSAIDLAITCINLANTYKFSGDIANAKLYLKKSESEFKKIKDFNYTEYYDSALDLYSSKIRLFEINNEIDSSYNTIPQYLKYISPKASTNSIITAYLESAEIASKTRKISEA